MPFDSTNYEPLRTGRGRLLALAEFLETKVPAVRFDLRYWADSERFEECGTAACACGWATTIPEFKALGFVLRDGPQANPMHRTIHIEYKGRRDFAAVRAFFGISNDDSHHLFGWAYYLNKPATPAAVAKRIRDFVAEHAAPATTTRPAR